jgi:hypothetical protein
VPIPLPPGHPYAFMAWCLGATLCSRKPLAAPPVGTTKCNSPHFTLSLKMATALLVETLDNIQHSRRRTPDSPRCVCVRVCVCACRVVATQAKRCAASERFPPSGVQLSCECVQLPDVDRRQGVVLLLGAALGTNGVSLDGRR